MCEEDVTLLQDIETHGNRLYELQHGLDKNILKRWLSVEFIEECNQVAAEMLEDVV
jgi:hypothetical protein